MTTKKFVQIYTLNMDGRNGEWYDTNENYEDAIKLIDWWNESVRIVEKTFNPETFEITVKEIKRTEKILKGSWWNGKVKETTKYAE